MKLTLQEQVALIYTSQGSQRRVAAFLGISHQKVGRILKAGMPELGGYAADSRALRNPELIAAVADGLARHAALARSAARRDGLPFSSEIPVYAERRFYQRRQAVYYRDGSLRGYVPKFLPDGRPDMVKGDRVFAEHLHWVSDRVRNAWLTKMQRSGKYHNASVGSIVDLRLYNRQANARARQRVASGERIKPRTMAAILHAEELKQAIAQGIERKRIFTPYVTMDPRFPASQILENINDALRGRHAPATDAPGAVFADQVLLQLNPSPHDSTKPGKKGSAKKRRR